MSLLNAFSIAGSGMMAQSQRLNAVASNMANVDTVAEVGGDSYKARKVVFESVLNDAGSNGSASGGVRVKAVTTDNSPPRKVYDPKHPMADKDGYIVLPNVNSVDEMVDMIAASRSYQTNAEIMNTAKSLMLKTLSLGQ
jgi:flagellar basal-body rod protein FlgC